MVVNETEREQAILDAAADLLLRLGYSKLTMGDVADAVALHRGLVYLRFKSKDELVEAVARRELDRYAERWSEQLLADPQGGSVASVYRAMAGALGQLPLAAAIVARDEATFGKYLRKPGSFFDRVEHLGTREFLMTMQEAGAVRRDIDTRAVAYILDSLTPALRHTFPQQRHLSADPELPTTGDMVGALAELLELGLTPSAGADLEAGKTVLLEGLSKARSNLTA
ncbi:TetR/AcrR family transcriptional regulator [Nocardia mexicana]|uniref:TetR family transcriptional regulator n=1 Tax=Nocardia mexicana TaxID=279262 RepID=A0A370H9H4_9NOCA|nr:TetR/AcrR family transcriptional regulator [Nocardia mexicana]RDI53301.1 TetR family transcriptional regulator [Nocardia mexicana]